MSETFFPFTENVPSGIASDSMEPESSIVIITFGGGVEPDWLVSGFCEGSVAQAAQAATAASRLTPALIPAASRPEENTLLMLS
ncbi:hypothetical protein [Ideonella dechloratans]|uniref:hypothetical protein n=1 Tax=Ideonella dechloratans TaxID=36863 RepID=UPI0035B2100B